MIAAIRRYHRYLLRRGAETEDWALLYVGDDLLWSWWLAFAGGVILFILIDIVADLSGWTRGVLVVVLFGPTVIGMAYVGVTCLFGSVRAGLARQRAREAGGDGPAT